MLHYETDDQRLRHNIKKAHNDWNIRHRRNWMIAIPQLMMILSIPVERATTWQPSIDAAMDEFGINTALRAAHFLAQVGHESGGFRYTKEIWTNSQAQQGYEWADRLGNNELGDGEKFMGRGPMQITGRKNYHLCGAFLNIDLLNHPELLEEVGPGAQSAGWFWEFGAGLNLGHLAIRALAKYGLGEGVNLNVIADQDDIETITYCINGGQAGLDDRKAIYQRARNVLGVV